jgi:hypothetical protein
MANKNPLPSQNLLQTAGPLGRIERLAAALLRERERPASTNKSTECFGCGRSFSRRLVHGDDNSRFCSKRCQDAYDAGFPAYDPNRDRALTNVPLSAWLLGGSRYFEPVLRGSRAWRRLGKSEEWTTTPNLKIRPKKPSTLNGLQGDFSRPTDPLIRSDWEPSKNIDPNHPDLAIPPFLDRRPRTEADREDVPDESIKQSGRAAA